MLSVEISPRGIASIRLDKPDQGNRYDDKMLRDLDRILKEFDKAERVRVIVLSGAGRHFCVGADVNWHFSTQRSTTRDLPVSLSSILLRLDRIAKPTVALVQGACIGGGVALAACCDIIIAAETAFFAIPEVRLGLPASSLVPLFVRAIGARAFRRYGLTGERFSAQEALSFGLVSEVVPAEQLAARLDQLIDVLLLGGPAAITQTKKLAIQYEAPLLDAAVLAKLERDFFATLHTVEAKEGIASFVEKRPPAWASGLLERSSN